MPNSAGRVQALGTHIHTILDAVTAEYAERVVQASQALVGCSITAIGEEAV